MAKTRDTVLTSLDSVFDALHVRAEKETTIIAGLLRDRDQIDMKSWDIRYGRTLLQSQLLPGFDPKNARQYFPISKALPAMQQITQDLFRIRFEILENAQTWHTTISACLLYDASTDRDELLGRLFFDMYHRDGKVDGVSTWAVRPPVSDRQLAEVILVTNLESRSGSCMSYKELRDLLHELGHCVHALLGKQRYARFSGPLATQTDFIEMPSQMLKLWLADKSLFDFAANENGERIPYDVLDKVLAAEEIGRGILRSEQIGLAKLAVSDSTTCLANSL